MMITRERQARYGRAMYRGGSAVYRGGAVVQALEGRVLMAADFRISEFIASNVSTLADEDAQFNDWVEIRNAGDTPGDLAGYRLTDNPAGTPYWTFPSVTVPAGGHVVVFASGKNRTDPAANLHTNFSLNADGEYLALLAPNGAVRTEFAPQFPDQEEDVSYGTDTATTPQPLRYFARPTPGSDNARAEVVINEIHYDPDVKTQLVEFVELHNPGAAPVDLAGAAFSNGIAYTFPAGAALPAGGYLVLAQNAAQFEAKYGVTPFGQYEGSLSNEGETVRLRNRSGGELDAVDYQPGFPWPSVGDAPGYSIELVNPDFDNSVGGNWRAQPPGTTPGTTLFASGTNWKYRKGTAEASSPVSAWRQPGFAETGWSTGPGPVGYDGGGVAMGTPLPDMSGSYSSVFLRKTFNVANASAVNALRLEALFDDGFNVWINGVPAYTQNVAPDAPVGATAGGAIEDATYRPFSLPTGALRTGQNVIAVQFFNSGLSNSSDAYFDARLIATAGGASPTPGRRNSVHAANVAPQMRQVNHSPEQPAGGEIVTVTAKITDPDGVASATLRYQVVTPGNYIEIGDPAYQTQWTNVAMRDDGTSGDALAGDGVYSAQVPASANAHRNLVRYRVTTTDGLGASVTAPYADDSVPNFAYFVYDGVPSWTGAVQPGVSPEVTYSAEVMRSVQAVHLISRQSDVEDATWWSRYGGDNYLWDGALVYDGKVYDHIRYRTRGGNAWRYAMGKNAWKIDFNNDHELEMKDDYGVPYAAKWGKLSLRANIQQGNFWHRGEGGLFESAGYKLMNLAGTPANRTTFTQLRIIDEAAEATADQYRGDFWGSYLAVEENNGDFLDEHGLPDGNIYDMEGGTGTLNNQGPTAVTDKSDLNAFLNTYNSTTPTDQWWRDNLHLAEYYAYRVIVEGIRHFDIADGKNYFYYLNPETNKWMVLPWDLDLTWSNNMYGSGNEPFRDRVLPRQAFNVEYDNAIRNIRDLLFNPDQAGQVIDEMAAKVWTRNQPSFVDADRAMWDYNPVLIDPARTYGDKGGHGRFYAGNPGGSGANQIIIPAPGGFEGMMNKMKAYVVERAAVLDGLANDGTAPNRPTLTYQGGAGFPADDLRFRSSNYADPQANPFAAMEWRLAEVTNRNAPGYDPKAPKKYEIDALWTSGELTSFDANMTVPGQYVVAGKTYRVRVRMKDNTGRWSNWSNAVQFAAGRADQTVVDGLRITEINYHPAPNPAGPPAEDEFEFVELQNTSATTINLKDVRFTNGIEYTFGDVSLGAGQFIVVARNRDAFALRYGTAGINLAAGQFAKSLDNASDHIELVDATNQTIHDFTYFDTWHPSTDGEGPTLVAASATQPLPAFDTAAGWRPSGAAHGSPGRADGPADSTPPTADIIDVTPDPRRATFDTITIVFSEPVTGFDKSDLTLTRNGGANLIASFHTLTTPDGGRTWVLGGLANQVGPEGTYVLTLASAGTGITDAAGNALSGGATDQWVMDFTGPLVDIVDVTPDPRSTPVDSIQIVFSEPVTGFNVADLRLFTRNPNQPTIPLTAAQTLTTTDNRTYTLGNLAGITGPLNGAYLLSLVGQGADIRDLAGNFFVGEATDEWFVAAVFGRHVFYNNSTYDGRNTALGAADDAAVATDKLALLPGAAAGFANYTSYSLGLNGIMVDIAGVPRGQARGFLASDFTFRVGTGADPSQWAAAPAPLQIVTRFSAGVGGSDRVSIRWADGAIKNTWLQVTVKPNSITGLAAPDVFYFGNLVGETGDSATAARVTAADYSGTRAQLLKRAGVTSRHDFNRDGRINTADLALTRAATGRSIPLLAPAAPAAVAAASSFGETPIAPTTLTSRLTTRRAWYEEPTNLLG